MASKKRKPRDPRRERMESRQRQADADRRERLRSLFYILALTVAVGLLYYGSNAIYPYAFLVFYGLAIVLGFGYVIANYCFARNGVTADMLPPTMSLEERQAYIRERDERRESTKWMLYLLIPLLLVIGVDLLYLAWGERFVAFFKSL